MFGRDARVSTNGQILDTQVEALEAGRRRSDLPGDSVRGWTDRAQLAKAIGALRTGDTLIVTRLDRLARSTRDLLKYAPRPGQEGCHVQIAHRCLG